MSFYTFTLVFFFFLRKVLTSSLLLRKPIPAINDNVVIRYFYFSLFRVVSKFLLLTNIDKYFIMFIYYTICF